MDLKKPKLDVFYHTDLETPELICSGCIRNNVENLEDIITDDIPGMVTLIQTSYYLDASLKMKSQNQEIIYMLGYLVPIKEVLEDNDKYKIFFPERFIEESSSDLMVVYESPSGRFRVRENSENIRVFATSEELMEAVYTFTREFLEKIKGVPVKEEQAKLFCKKRDEKIEKIQ